jgi:hypothetical protein
MMIMYYGIYKCSNGHSFDWSFLVQHNQSESEAGVGHCPKCDSFCEDEDCIRPPFLLNELIVNDYAIYGDKHE